MHAHPVRQVVARLKAGRGTAGVREARESRGSTQATASHAHAERRIAIQGPLVLYELLQISYSI